MLILTWVVLISMMILIVLIRFSAPAPPNDVMAGNRQKVPTAAGEETGQDATEQDAEDDEAPSERNGVRGSRPWH